MKILSPHVKVRKYKTGWYVIPKIAPDYQPLDLIAAQK